MTRKNLPTTNHKLQTNAGFTLVELAIVIIIVGLLVGGVLQGQELINQAKIRSQIKQLANIEAQHNIFKSKYNCIAGDCINAQTFFGATDKNGYAIRNGDGDNLVRSIVGAGTPFASNNCSQGAIYGSELPQYWLQINDAGLGSYSSDGNSNNLRTGYPETATSSEVGALVTCFSTAGSGFSGVIAKNPALSINNVAAIGVEKNNTNNTNRVVYITGLANWTPTYHPEGYKLGISVELINQIDIKIDDGLAISGKFGVIGEPSTGCLTGSNTYPLPSVVCDVTAGQKLD
jgi:prepilin-type N-terminal cleavage/methylation domain-containing protein